LKLNNKKRFLLSLIILILLNCNLINDNILIKTNFIEKESKNIKDQNDSFETAEKITANSNITGFIGVQKDIDYYYFNGGFDGIITVKADISKSFKNKNIWSLSASIYTDNWLGSNTSNAATNPNLQGNNIIDRETLKITSSSVEFKQSISKYQKKYILIISSYSDNNKYKGFDNKNPYIITIRYDKAQTLETDQPEINKFEFKEADNWQCSNEILFDNKNYGTSIIKSWAYYWYDIDWYFFNADKDGWLRVTYDITNHEDNNPFHTSINLHGSLYKKEENVLEKTDFKIEALDSPGCPYTFQEFTEIKSLNKYYFKVFCFEFSKKFPYKLKFEYYPGSPEDSQPGEVKASDDPFTAYDLGIININDKKRISSFIYHYFDYDYYKIKTADDSDGIMTINLNYKVSFDKFGWLDDINCYKNPFGIKIWLYLYDNSIADNSSDYIQFLKASLKKHSPYQDIIYNAKKDSKYYILVNSRANWDLENPYSLEINYKKIDPSYDYLTKR